jgi:microcystin-dependent protein
VTANLFNATTLQVSATLTANNATIAGLTAGVMAQLFVGCPVECAGALPSPGVTITALQTTSVTVSTNVAAGFGGAHTVTFLPYGQGDGVSSFNVIDLRGATVVGVGQGPGRTNRIQGQTFGTETVSMSVAQLPTHTHLSTDNGHQHCAGGVLSGTETDINGGEKLHWHYTVAVNSFGPTGWPYQVLVTAPSSTVNFLWGGPGGGRIPITPAPSDPGVPPQEWGTDPTNPPTTSPQVEPHQHMVFDNVVPSGVQIGNAIDATHTPASNQPLSNMPPSAVVRYLVKI